MSMSGPAHEARILAETEAEVRAGDPQLWGLFESFSRDSALAGAQGRRPAARQRRRRARAALLLIATLLAVACGPGGQAVWATASSWGVTGMADRAATDVQHWMTQQARHVQASICRSIPAPVGGACD